MQKDWKCPSCEQITRDFPAISRRDNKTKICSGCGLNEALEDFKKNYFKDEITGGKK